MKYFDAFSQNILTSSSLFVDPGGHSSGLNASACSGIVGSRGASAEVHRAAGHCSHHQPHRTVALHPGRAEVRSPLGNCGFVSYCGGMGNFEGRVHTVICIFGCVDYVQTMQCKAPLKTKHPLGLRVYL